MIYAADFSAHIPILSIMIAIQSRYRPNRNVSLYEKIGSLEKLPMKKTRFEEMKVLLYFSAVWNDNPAANGIDRKFRP